jgi:nucleotide-binding universal stress UspA family protein
MSAEDVSSVVPTKILVPIDFSPSSHAAWNAAAELAGLFHAEIHLVHVVPMFSSPTLPDFVPETRLVETAKGEAERHFEALRAGMAGKGVKVSYSVEIGNDVARQIVEVLQREHAGMVVISTHGISGWYPLVFGSIAEKIVKLVDCPLLLLRTPKPGSSAQEP